MRMSLGRLVLVAISASGFATAASAAPIAMETLRGATIEGLLTDQPITLTDGAWEGPPLEPGSFIHESGWLLDITATGDLDGDGDDETVGLVEFNGGGSGVFLYAVVFEETAGVANGVAATMIGDRNMVRSLSIADQRIALEVVTQGPEDGACCATMKAGVLLQLLGSQLITVAAEPEGFLSIADLDGAWTLVGLSREEPAPAEPVITLTVADGAISGSGGCNLYRAAVSGGVDRVSVAVGAIGSTKMACAPEVMQLEQAYLNRLAAVTSFGFEAGKLALYDANYEPLIFAPVAAE